jgi:hypothetical protein
MILLDPNHRHQSMLQEIVYIAAYASGCVGNSLAGLGTGIVEFLGTLP